MKNNLANLNELEAFKNHPISEKIDEVMKTVIKLNKTKADPMSLPIKNNEDELVLDELEIDFSSDVSTPADEGMDLSLSEGESLDLSDGELPQTNNESDMYGELSLDDEDDIRIENLGDLSFPEIPHEGAPGNSKTSSDDELSLDDMTFGSDELSLSDEAPMPELNLNNDISEDVSLSFDSSTFGSEAELSEDAKEKLKEIDAIMDYDASQVAISSRPLKADAPIDEPLVSEDLNLDSLDFGNDNEEAEEVEKNVVAVAKEEKPKKKKKDASDDRNYGQDLKDISGAYSGEMERMQATISNLRTDRAELLARIEKLENDTLLQNRQTLTLRAELDEKKIELTIIRKKLNEEINDLKDRLKLFDEKKLILEEKTRILVQELDKASQKNKMDVKKVQLREKELEQKLELLKSDAESQIRHRDLKILELKRKIDGMEFDMESISNQEKRSVESRYELEDKLEKAIKTLRGAITVLEEESDRTNALDALKKNIDM